MAIQDQFTSQWTDTQMPRSVITIKGDTGSVSLPPSARLFLIDCTDVAVTCAGDNEINCSNCSITSINAQKTLIRITNPQSVGSVTGTNVKFNCAGATIQSLDLTLAEVNLMGCTVQSASYNQCDLTSINNKYTTFSSNADIINSENDTVSGSLTFSNSALGTFVTLTSSNVTCQDSTLTLSNNSISGTLSATDSVLTVINGTVGSLTASGDKSIVNMSGTTVSGTMQLDDGASNLDSLKVTGLITGQNANINANKLTGQGITLASGNLILVNSTCSASVNLTDSAATFNKNTISGTCSLSTGAITSTNNTYQTLTILNGTISSFGDSVSELTATGLLGNSKFNKLSGQLTLTGGSQYNTVDLSNIPGQVSASNVSLITSSNLANLTVTNSSVIDQKSTIQSTNCNIIATASTIHDSGSLITIKNGQVIGSSNTVVVTSGGTVSNPTGLTLGAGFSAASQGASVLYADSNLTVQCTTGIINLIEQG